jgi:SAM-dependent methyltransferase
MTVEPPATEEFGASLASRMRAAASMWTGGLAVGLATLAREPVLGLKRVILPSSYWRTMEFAYVYRQLGHLPAGSRVLDVGSPKELAMILARRKRFAVTATDLLPEPVELGRRYARAQGIDGDGPGLVRSETQDGRQFTYPDNSFDAAFAVSVLEHIPGDGDTEAMREMVRVVKPGGRIVVTTPYDLTYREDTVPGSFSGRADDTMMWERHYDEEALGRRLTSVAGASLADSQRWGETGLPGERFLGALGVLRWLVSPLEGPIAAVALKRLGPRQGRAMAAFFTLEVG